MDFVYVCKESLSRGLIEGFFSWGVKERLRLLFKLRLEEGVYYKNLTAGLSFCRYGQKLWGHGPGLNTNKQKLLTWPAFDRS